MAQPKIRVYGTAQNRTALGIANAYLRLNPSTTLEQLNGAFPETLFTSNAGLIFAKADAEADTKRDIYFDAPDELLDLKEGKAKMFKTWTKSDYQRFVEHAEQYGIVVAEVKPSSAFTKGGYVLEEVTNGPAAGGSPKKKSRWWLWLLLLLLLIILLLLLLRCCGCCSGRCDSKNGEISALTQKPSAETDTNTSAVADSAAAADGTVQTEVTRTLDEHFAAVQFQKGKADVTPASRAALQAIASKLKEYPNATLKVEGHASKDGSLEFNQRLSEQRAKNIVDYIAAQGVERDRLTYEGRGISMPIDEAQPEANRRVEFIVGSR